MAGPTYKIRIIKTGIGDPFLLGEFEFITSGGYANPANDAVQDLTIKVEFSNDGDSYPNYGTVTMQQPIKGWQMSISDGTAPRYFFGLPFDPGENYTSQQTIYLRLTFSCSNGSIILGNGSDNSQTITLPYSGDYADLPSVAVYYYWQNT
ncbi:MAG TPA: hypothetical protein VHS96_17430, partial [Bacteroidia bacterium]|jgi:hypothetical protein|nr:hypothetical protein [Bacteroidia bacterium]